MFSYLATQNTKVMLLCDGFDEISYEQGEIIDIIKGNLYQNLRCITTCRPHASHGIVFHVDFEIKLKGFSAKQAKLFLEMYARTKFTVDVEKITKFVSKTWKQIESSVDLFEMSTNPSMQQLICILSYHWGKLGKDKATVFEYYTKYLLTTYHVKTFGDSSPVPNVYVEYRDVLLKAGQLALKGLKQNLLQLVFDKHMAIETAGQEIFDIGFVTELPSSDPGSVKVQFLHKSLQEYLAAFYVVSCPNEKGLQLLMEFCSSSQRLMGSQIILNFISAMSQKLRKVIQNQIKKYVSSWATDDEVDPKSRTSFLIAMLKDNKSLGFPLPKIIDIDLRDFDSVSKRIKHTFQHIFGIETTVERFLKMDSRGLQQIKVVLGDYNRLELFKTRTIGELEALEIDFRFSSSSNEVKILSHLIQSSKPRNLLLSQCVQSTVCSSNLLSVFVDTKAMQTLIFDRCQMIQEHCIRLLNKIKHLNTLRMHKCGLCVNSKLAEAICNLPIHTQVDISGNKFIAITENLLLRLLSRLSIQSDIDLSGLSLKIDEKLTKALTSFTNIDLSNNQVPNSATCAYLISNSGHMKSLNMSNCGIEINSEIAEAVSNFPENTPLTLDLSGNTLTEMTPKLLSQILPYMPKQEHIDIHRWGITIDTDVIDSLRKVPCLKSLYLNGDTVASLRNSITPEAARNLSFSVQFLPQLRKLDLCKFGIHSEICLELLLSLSKHCLLLEELNLSDSLLTADSNEVVDIIKIMRNMKWLWLNHPDIVEVREKLRKTNPKLHV